MYDLLYIVLVTSCSCHHFLHEKVKLFGSLSACEITRDFCIVLINSLIGLYESIGLVVSMSISLSLSCMFESIECFQWSNFLMGKSVFLEWSFWIYVSSVLVSCLYIDFLVVIGFSMYFVPFLISFIRG